ncbi:hypothetical protein BN975_03859 [Mycolicibacterium farcinogenes]|nr:hypothetical protein BN975_03859 [Mycolicibacterium farcinogenes]
MVVEVGDGDQRIALAQCGHQLRGGQRTTAERDEVGFGAVDGRSEHVAPQPGEPAHGAFELRCVLIGVSRRRPRQGVAVHLPRGSGGQLVEQHQPGHQGGRQRLRQGGPGSGQIEVGVRAGDIADQQRGAACGLAYRGGTATDAGQMHERVVDLAQFDAAPADLDLIVGAPLEVQAVGLQTHQVAAAVGAVPAERRHGRVLLGVLLGVEVAGQAHSADHEFADLADGHRHAVLVDHRQVPAGQRQADADRPLTVQLGGAGHHGRLGRAVGVPHLAAVDGETGRQLGRASLAPEDQQPHRFQCLGRPQCGQGRNCGHHGDVAAHQPRAEVHAAAHQ